nr:MAG TPA: hypothetical protein [Caudoviricetes sp.]
MFNHFILGKPESFPLPRPADRQGWIDTTAGNYEFQ